MQQNNPILSPYFRFLCFLLAFAVLLASCLPAPSPGPAVYLVRDLPNDLIGLLWLELPAGLQDGAVARLLAADPHLQETLVPSLVDLPCQPEDAQTPLAYGPAEVPIQLQADGRFEIHFPWDTCSPCIECYMHIYYTLIFSGQLPSESLQNPALYPARLNLDVSMIHSGQAAPAALFQAILSRQPAPLTEPYLICNAPAQCQPVEFRPIP